MAHILETERLALRELNESDAGFYLAMLTDPAFRQHIGDRGVRTEAQALENLRDRVFASYDAYGFGMWLVSRRADGTALGIAGLVKRPFLEDVDLGYAFLPAGRGAGYATEAASAVMHHAATHLGLTRLAAIVSPANSGSIRVLERLGFEPGGQVRFPDGGETTDFYSVDLTARGRVDHSPASGTDPTSPTEGPN